MSRLESFLCTKCQEVKEKSFDPNDFSDPICSSCHELEADAKRQEHFDRLKGLSFEERVTKLEKDAYDHSLVKGHTNSLLLGSS